jgi:hypothetical protein
VSTKLRRIVTTVLVGVGLTAGMMASAGPASAGPASAAPATIRPLYCGWTHPAPEHGGLGVIGSSSSSGCEGFWRFTATLQSSRWWGWHNDDSRSWNGNGLVFPTSTCAGTHDFRIAFHADNGLVGYDEYSPTVTLTC